MKLLNKMPNLHPNGFWIYLVKAFWNGARLRLHYWPRGEKRLDTPHDHRSWFISVPLWGRFLEKRFVEADGEDFEVLRCHQTSGNGKPLTTSIGVGNVRQTSQRYRYPFIPYFCGLGAIHALVPKGLGPAITVVLFGPPKKTPKAWVQL